MNLLSRSSPLLLLTAPPIAVAVTLAVRGAPGVAYARARLPTRLAEEPFLQSAAHGPCRLHVISREDRSARIADAAHALRAGHAAGRAIDRHRASRLTSPGPRPAAPRAWSHEQQR
jgi:hypothetical protein